MEKNKLYFDQEEMIKMAWYSMHNSFWICQFQWLLLLQYFATLHKIWHLKTIARKCTNFTFFIWECEGLFCGIRIKFHMGRTKGRAKRRVWGQKPKMRVFFAKFPLLSMIQTFSYKPLVRQTSNYHHCYWHAQNPICREF